MKRKYKISLLLLLITLMLQGCEEKQDRLLPLEMLAVSSKEPVLETAGKEAEEAPTEETDCFIHVCGAVRNPGVYKLPAGSRIFECVNAAGGFTEEAGQDGVNLAMPVEDGARVWIPTEKEVEERACGGEGVTGTGRINGVLDLPDGRGGTNSLMNINTASAEMLCTLPGIGRAKADSIIRYREQKGAFGRIEDIMKVEGIKEGLFSKISDRITV